jgi:DNA repair exonuclease SbcCD ATPase subunit
MDAARIQWRPLGQMLVDRGLLTPEELEEVLQDQQQSGRPLGQIIVDRKLISGPTLAVTLAEQCGVELATDTGFGTGLWTAIQRRHKEENRRRTHLRPVSDEESERLILSAETEERGPAVVNDPPTTELEAALQERDASVAALQAEGRARAQALEQLLEQLADRDERLREMAGHSRELDATSAQLAEANARVAELEEAVQERQRRIEALEAEDSPPKAGKKGKDLERSLREEAVSVDRRARELSKQLDQLESERKAIEERAEEVHERESALEVLTAELADRERHLDARLQQVESESAALTDRARELDEHEQALAGRQRAVLTAAADLERRRSSLEEREHALALREAEDEDQRVRLRNGSATQASDLQPHLPLHLEPPRQAGDHHWRLDTLSRLVEDRAGDFPDRADEWRYTLFYLRNEARIDGALPRRFDSLVEECFGELLVSR